MSNIDRVTLITPDAVAPEGHDAKMMAVVDAAAAKNAPTDRPSWLPEKFATVEDLAASYAELEAHQGSAKKEAAPEAATPDPAKVDTPETPADPSSVVAKAGLDMGALNSEYAKDGKLSEDSLAKLEAVGVDRATVDQYIAGRVALSAAYDLDVTSVTPGGSEAYAGMAEWAKVNMSPAEIDSYNDAVSSGNKDRAKLAVQGLGARYTADVGNEPRLMGGRTGTSQADSYESLAQMKVDMKDPRYKNDPAFRRVVAEKLGRSPIM